jgi:hypothetical protein
MPAGNASNTVFTTIPVGKDFFMSFSTERYFRNVYPADFRKLTFKLYDARLIGPLSSPNPNALIEEVNNAAFDAVTNPKGSPGRFSITSTNVLVFVSKTTLDTYESTRTSGQTTVFKGELYGYVNAEVGGFETGEWVDLGPAKMVESGLKLSSPSMFENVYWDGFFYNSDIQDPVLASAVSVATYSGPTIPNQVVLY